MKLPATLLPLAALGVASLSAQTVAHWRFEDSPGFLADSSGSYTLSNNSSVTQVATPFSNPIPRTGAANTEAAAFNGTNYLTVADNDAFTSNTFSLEAFFTTGSATSTSTQIIAGQFGSGSTTATFQNQRGYAIGINSGKVRLLIGSSDGTATANFDAFTLSNSANYYVAATVNISDTGNSAITLYLQDLSTSTLQSVSFARNAPSLGATSITSIRNAAAPFTIGATAQGSALFTGTIDEVRLSNVKLAQSDLLITAIPEPSSVAALAGLGALGFVATRRRRARA